jgi:hypothetical protein
MSNIISFRNNKNNSIELLVMNVDTDWAFIDGRVPVMNADTDWVFIDDRVPVMNADTEWVFVDDGVVEYHNWIFAVDGTHHWIKEPTYCS